MPAFSYYEEQTDQPIARTIVEYRIIDQIENDLLVSGYIINLLIRYGRKVVFHDNFNSRKLGCRAWRGSNHWTSDEPQGFDIVEIKVDEIHEVEEYPNLVAAYLEDEIEPLLPVLMPIEIIDQFQIALGTILECRVRRVV